jgi:hypothetical protein
MPPPISPWQLMAGKSGVSGPTPKQPGDHTTHALSFPAMDGPACVRVSMAAQLLSGWSSIFGLTLEPRLFQTRLRSVGALSVLMFVMLATSPFAGDSSPCMS